MKPIIIYNIFPRLIGKLSEWDEHLERAEKMKCTWIYINPIHYTGFSGSIYSIKDYYKIDNIIAIDENKLDDFTAVKYLIKKIHNLGMKVMFDLVINHTAIDSVLVEEHLDWYKLNENGKPKNPCVYEGDKLITVWGDLAEIDNENSKDKENLWNYWKNLIKFMIELGVDGFRADAAYQVPTELWKYLIEEAKKINPNITFFAETLGTTIDKVIELGKAGFDYTFNSSKWWDFHENWCMKQYEENRLYSKSISFAESHDTERLAKEYYNNIEAIKMRYLFSVIFSTGVMFPIGMEYGFNKKLDVVKTRSSDWEGINFDLTSFISECNELKYNYPDLFADECEMRVIDTGNYFVLGLLRQNEKEKALILLNSDKYRHQEIYFNNLYEIFGNNAEIIDISIEYSLDKINPSYHYGLRPSQVIILYQKNNH